jgi:hypothetical protein
MADDNAEEIRFEWLDGPESQGPRPATETEWSKIDDLLLSQGWMSLNRVLTRIRVGWDKDDNIVALSTVQMLPQVGPMWVAKRLRATGTADDLVAETVKFLTDVKCRGWIVIADSPHTAKIAKRQGMVRIESPVYITPIEKVQ